MESSFQLMIAYDMIYYVKFTALSIKTCLLKHEIALYTESTEAVCGKSDCLNTPFVTRTFHYILGICNHKYTLYYLVYPYLSFIKCIFMS